MGLHIPLQPVAWQRWENPNPDGAAGGSSKIIGADGFFDDARGYAQPLQLGNFERWIAMMCGEDDGDQQAVSTTPHKRTILNNV